MRQYLNNQYQADENLSGGALGRICLISSGMWIVPLVAWHFRYNLRQLVAPDACVLVVLREPLRRTVSALRHLSRDPNFHRLTKWQSTSLWAK